MDKSQRSMVAAKIANMEIGTNQHSASANLQAHTRQEAAAQLNVSERSVNIAKKVEKKDVKKTIGGDSSEVSLSK